MNHRLMVRYVTERIDSWLSDEFNFMDAMDVDLEDTIAKIDFDLPTIG